jgi:hypothetical protein
MGDGTINTASTDVETLADKYGLEEFKLLRGEIELRGSEQRSMERYVVLADAAIYALLLFPEKDVKPPDTPLVNLAWSLPPLIGLLALIRWRESVRMIRHLALYLKGREHAVMGPNQGWENYLAKARTKGDVPIVSGWYLVFWTLLLGGTSAISAYKNLTWLNWQSLVPATIAAALVGLGIVVYVLNSPSKNIQ